MTLAAQLIPRARQPTRLLHGHASYCPGFRSHELLFPNESRHDTDLDSVRDSLGSRCPKDLETAQLLIEPLTYSPTVVVRSAAVICRSSDIILHVCILLHTLSQ